MVALKRLAAMVDGETYMATGLVVGIVTWLAWRSP